MHLALRLSEYFADHSLFVNKEGRTKQARIFPSIELFLPPDPVFIDKDMLRVSQQGEGEVEFRLELLMFFFVVRADAQDSETFFFQQDIIIPEIAGLYGTSRGAVFRIEIEYDLFSFVTGQRHFFSVLVPGCECRGFVAFLQMGHLYLFSG